MFRCDEVSKKVSLGLDAPMPLGTRLLIRMHQWMCRHCSRFNRQLQRLRELSRYDEEIPADLDCPPDHHPNLSPEARERIKARLRCEDMDRS